MYVTRSRRRVKVVDLTHLELIIGLSWTKEENKIVQLSVITNKTYACLDFYLVTIN